MYAQHNIAAITDIPALVGSFAQTVGFTVDLASPTAPKVKHPTYLAGITFELTASIGGTNNQDHMLTWMAIGAPVVTSNARIYSPRLNGTISNPVVPSPTKVHLYGALLPEPYLITTVEYGFNQYRHLYFGYMEKLGAYDGGEVIAGTSPIQTGTVSTDNVNFRNERCAHLFSAHQSAFSAANCGGVRVIHAGASIPWHIFRSSGTSFATLPDGVMFGGFSDDINDGYLARGKSPVDGRNILVPINLYASKAVTADASFIPVGRPAGVRLVHMQDIDPGAVISVGGENWHCFPTWRKSPNTSFPRAPGSGFQWMSSETSYWIGLAMLEGAP